MKEFKFISIEAISLKHLKWVWTCSSRSKKKEFCSSLSSYVAVKSFEDIIIKNNVRRTHIFKSVSIPIQLDSDSFLNLFFFLSFFHVVRAISSFGLLLSATKCRCTQAAEQKAKFIYFCLLLRITTDPISFWDFIAFCMKCTHTNEAFFKLVDGTKDEKKPLQELNTFHFHTHLHSVCVSHINGSRFSCL